MSPSVQLSEEQLKEINEDDIMTYQLSREIHKHLDRKEILYLENSHSVLSSVLNSNDNKFQIECLEASIRLMNAYPISESKDNGNLGNMNSILGLPQVNFLAHRVWAIGFLIRRWVCDLDMPGVLVADETGLMMTFTSLPAPMI